MVSVHKTPAMISKLGPREKGRKTKGKHKPQAVRQAKQRRSALLKKLSSNRTNAQ